MQPSTLKFDTSLWQKSINIRIEERENNRIYLLEKIINNLTKKIYEIDVESMYIFGSITKQNMFTEHSDIDIAIKNKALKVPFSTVWNQLENICEHNIDLLDLDECNFANFIINNGIKIK